MMEMPILRSIGIAMGNVYIYLWFTAIPNSIYMFTVDYYLSPSK
jgi:hypothetical protein